MATTLIGRGGWRGVALMGLLALLAACGPEAQRTQGGGRGADIGNRPADSAAVEIHGRTDPGYDTPLQGQAIREQQE